MSACPFCQSLSARTAVLALDRESAGRRTAAFGSLRPSTRFHLFTCTSCNTDWKWSQLRGWHHAKLPVRASTVFSFVIPTRPAALSAAA